jgi:hypothetical protein
MISITLQSLTDEKIKLIMFYHEGSTLYYVN